MNIFLFYNFNNIVSHSDTYNTIYYKKINYNQFFKTIKKLKKNYYLTLIISYFF